MQRASDVQVNARVLPPPDLMYNKEKPLLRIGTAGSWNMTASTFCEPSGFASCGVVSFCNPQQCGGGQQNPHSLEVWLLCRMSMYKLSPQILLEGSL